MNLPNAIVDPEFEIAVVKESNVEERLQYASELRRVRYLLQATGKLLHFF